MLQPGAHSSRGSIALKPRFAVNRFTMLTSKGALHSSMRQMLRLRAPNCCMSFTTPRIVVAANQKDSSVAPIDIPQLAKMAHIKLTEQEVGACREACHRCLPVVLSCFCCCCCCALNMTQCSWHPHHLRPYHASPISVGCRLGSEDFQHRRLVSQLQVHLRSHTYITSNAGARCLNMCICS